MKKQIMAIVLIAGLTVATAASTSWGRGGDGAGNCPQMQGQMMQGQMMQGQMMPPPDPETRAKVAKFFKDNQALHKQLVMKQAEKHALMRSEQPDPQAAAKVAGELFDLRTTLHEKAEAAGVSEYIGRMGGGKGMHGPGPGAGGRPGMMGPNTPQ